MIVSQHNTVNLTILGSKFPNTYDRRTERHRYHTSVTSLDRSVRAARARSTSQTVSQTLQKIVPLLLHHTCNTFLLLLLLLLLLLFHHLQFTSTLLLISTAHSLTHSQNLSQKKRNAHQILFDRCVWTYVVMNNSRVRNCGKEQRLLVLMCLKPF